MNRYEVEGYFVGALRTPGDRQDEWERDHLLRCHGVSSGIVLSGDWEAMDRLHQEHHANDDVIPVPHQHVDFVPDAIEASAYSRKLKDALLGVIAVADLETEVYAVDAKR